MSDKAIFDKAYFEEETKNRLNDYFNRQKIAAIEVADRVERLVKLQKGMSKVLEIGCAFGQSTSVLRYRGYPAYGCDISEYSIGAGQQRLNVPIFQADLEDPNFVNVVRQNTGYKDFDLIFSCITLEHIHPEVAARVIGNLFEITKPGGVNYHAIDLMQAGDVTHYCVRPRSWWIEQFARAGFVPLPVTQEGVEKNWFLFEKGAVANG